MPTSDDAPLVILLHGWDQTAADVRPVADGITTRLATVALDGPSPTPAGRRAWWDEAHGPQDAAAHVLDWIDARVAPTRPVGLFGFSQGARVVAELLRLRPARFGASVLCAGYLEPGEDTPAESLRAVAPPALCLRGAEDWIVIPERGERLRAWLAAHTRLESRLHAGVEHVIADDMLDDANAFLSRHLR